ncbi:MAG: ABC transporter permease subunit [bacterium]
MQKKRIMTLLMLVGKALLKTVFLVLLSTWLTALVLGILPQRERSMDVQQQGQTVEQRSQTVMDRYGDWLVGLLHFDLGHSEHYFGDKVSKYVFSNLLLTFSLSLFSVIISAAFGVLLGVHSAIRSSWRIQPPPDAKREAGFNLFRYTLYVINAVPTYILGIMLLLIATTAPMGLLVMISMVLGSGIMMDFAQMSARLMEEEFQEPYVLNALGLGMKAGGALPRPGTVSWHAFRAASASLLPLIGSKVPFIMGNVLVIEMVFELPGLSEPLLGGLINQDLPLVLSVLLLAVLVVQVIAALTEVLDFVINPGKQFLI